MEQEGKKETKTVTPNAETSVKADKDLVVKNKSVLSGPKDSTKNDGGVWWVNPQGKPCESRSKACRQREPAVEKMKAKEGFDQCSHLQECKRKSEDKPA